MDDRNFQSQNKIDDGKGKKFFWKNFGLVLVALGLAVLTVVIINL